MDITHRFIPTVPGKLTQAAFHWLRKYALILVAIPLVITASFLALSGTTAPNIPVLPLSSVPLYAATGGDKPALALALSVEFPTVGAQYVDPDNNNSSTTVDPTYSPSIEYLGYYDAESCYTYKDTLLTGETSADKRFVRRGSAIPLSTPNTANPTWTSRMCWDGTKSYSKDDGTTPAFSTTSNDAFSGNFLNWASSSAIDMLRLALTGGDRVIDTATLTVLQRAVIPDGDPISMGNSSNFPSKRLYASGTSRAITSATAAAASYVSGVSYFGAVPTSMATTAAGTDIYVANTLNRIYFGPSSGRSGNTSGTLSGYTLGSSTTSVYQIGTITNSTAALPGSYQLGTVANSNADLPSGRTWCADRGDTCTLPSGTKKEIWYGEDDSHPDWKVVPATGAVPCTDAVLGDPGGSPKKCYYRTYTGSWTPVTWCASENGTCTLPSGTWEVQYGANTSWKVAPATGVVPCTNSLWGDPLVGTAKACYYRAYTGSWTPTTATQGINSDGYFFARVQVCDRDPSTYALKENRYWNFCTRYLDGATTPNTSYKPTGVIQKYADQLRLAAFGYLMDQTTDRYGGVLRAPMKYVGPRTFDINGNENTPTGGNPKQEWNPVTGQFYANPDSNTTVATTDGRSAYLSGVVSYVNQFGRTGSVPGRYKKYDPIGELHYQALRYLQGLSPSSSAISSITTAMYDGFPVYTTWTDPYGDGRSCTDNYSCIKSNILIIGDINAWDYNNRLPTASAANNIPDIAYWQGITSSFESNAATSYVDGQGVTRTTGNPFTSNSASLTSASGNTSIVGSAYWAHTHDIRGTSWTNATSAGTAGTTLQRPCLRVKTFGFDVNEYGGSNSATTRRTSNQIFRAAKYGGFETDPSNTAKNPFNTWGNPFKKDDGTVNNYVWEDTDTRASRVGEANTYFLQSDARGVLSAFDDIFSRASTASNTNNGAAVSSKELRVADANAVFQASFDTSDWSGDLEAKPIVVNSSHEVSISTTTNWTAAARLAALTAPATSRNIIVGKVDDSTATATAFTWTAIEAGLVTHLNGTDGLGQDRLNYLRGDRSKEGNPFRLRYKLLGDIVNSGVAYSGKPTDKINSASYIAFYNDQIEVPGTDGHAARTPAVFVGANDGMLHAFHATTGAELFAYIPSWLGSKLAALTSSSYITAHQSYADGTPVVAEAQVGSAGTADDWKTVLVSGTGGGGQGVFALDVTNPAAFSASKVMWEFTNDDDPDMGYVVGEPKILKLRTSAYNASPLTYKWFAVVPGGVNSYSTANASGQFGSGNPTLFFLDLSKPVGTSWTPGTNYYKVSLPIDSTFSQTHPTGLVNFGVSLSKDKADEVAQMYLGDLHGNLWKLDFSFVGSANWNMNKLTAFNKGTTTSPLPYPFYIAKDSASTPNVQPITMVPTIMTGPSKDTSYVFFGTGKYLETADKGSTAQQTVYMLYDDNTITDGDSDPVGDSAISGRGRLRAKSATTSSGVITISSQGFVWGRTRTNTDNTTVGTTVRSGWYYDFTNSGERQVYGATNMGSLVKFNSTIPGASSTGSGSCLCSSSGGGGGNEYQVDIFGNGTGKPSVVGLLGAPLVFEIVDDTTTSHSDSTGRRNKTKTYASVQQGSKGLSDPTTTTVSYISGRLSWRQINNYQDLRNTP